MFEITVLEVRSIKWTYPPLLAALWAKRDKGVIGTKLHINYSIICSVEYKQISL